MTSAARRRSSSAASASSTRQRRGRQAAQLDDAGLGGERLEPQRFDADALADQAALAEERAQFGGLVGVAAVDRGDGVRARCCSSVSSRASSPAERTISTVRIKPYARASEVPRGDTRRFRIERDSLGELQGPGGCAVGRADAARRREFPDQRPAHAARVHPRARPDQVGRGDARTTSWTLLDAKRAAAIQKAALEVAEGQHDAQFPDRRVPDRLGHQHQHECQRGDRAPRDSQYAGAAGASERSRQHGPEPQRRHPDRDPRERRCSAIEQHLLPALAYLRAVHQPPHRRDRRHRQDRPHAPDGCDAGDARPGAERLAHADRTRQRARHGVPRAPAGARARRHGRRHRHQRASANSPRAPRAICRSRAGSRCGRARNYFEALSSQDAAVELSGQLQDARGER